MTKDIKQLLRDLSERLENDRARIMETRVLIHAAIKELEKFPSTTKPRKTRSGSKTSKEYLVLECLQKAGAKGYRLWEIAEKLKQEGIEFRNISTISTYLTRAKDKEQVTHELGVWRFRENRNELNS